MPPLPLTRAAVAELTLALVRAPSGLGLLEYLEFFEDVGMEPIMAVWSGEYTLRSMALSQGLTALTRI